MYTRQVYKATTLDGVEVAVKIQRPGLENKIALDFYVLLKLLGLAQWQFQISESIEIVEAVLDEVLCPVLQCVAVFCSMLQCDAV